MVSTPAPPSCGAAFETRKLDGAGLNKEKITMNIKTFKKLCLKSNTKRADQIHDYFIKLEEILNDLICEETDELRLQLEDSRAKLERFEKRPSTYGFLDNKNGYVYLIHDISKPGHYKVGMANDTEKRLRNLNTSSSEKTLHCIYKLETQNAEFLEKLIHIVLQPFNIRGRKEWFYFDNEEQLNYAIHVFEQSIKFLENFNFKTIDEFLKNLENIPNYLENIDQEHDINNSDITETNIYKLNRQNTKGKNGKFKGVFWCVDKNKWRAELKRNYIVNFLGYFDNDIDAAKSYNNYATYLNQTHNTNYSMNDIDEKDYIPLALNIPKLNIDKNEEKKTSKYNGVFYNKTNKIFHSSIKHMTITYHLGINHDEKECAKLYNKQAAYFNLIDPNAKYVLNDDFDKTPENILKDRMENFKNKKSSQYHGVTWCKSRKKWKAVIVINKKQFYLGFYETEIEAAIEYNNRAIDENNNKNNSRVWKVNNI